MGESPKRGEGSDGSAADHAALLELITKTEQTVERVPKATVKGMTPLQRPPAPPDNTEDE
jgi:hypothetical protein